jgi:hypothetical protein
MNFESPVKEKNSLMESLVRNELDENQTCLPPKKYLFHNYDSENFVG